MSISQSAETQAAPRPTSASAWDAFAGARTLEQFQGAWLAILCEQIESVRGALLLVGSQQANTFVPAAVWPDPSRDMAYLAPTAQRALAERQGVVEPRDAGPGEVGRAAEVAYPVEVGGQVHGAVVLDLAPRPEAELQRALRLVHWGAAWLVDLFRQQELAQREQTIERLGIAADLVATAVQEKRFRPAALAVVNELARRLDCDRVCLGADRDGYARVEAMSHSAMFDPKTVLSRRIAEAMDETLDLGAPIAWPSEGDGALTGAAHAALAHESSDAAILSVPLAAEGRDWGVLMLERARGEPFDARAIELVRAIGLLIGPVLHLRRENDRGFFRRTRDALVEGVRVLFGPRYPGLKLVGTLALLLVVAMSLLTGEHRVTARTVVEGEVQRAIVAPFEGYVAESLVRAGDTVKAGQLLVRLDDRDLRLEHARWTAEREQHLRKYRQALAARDRANMNVFGAQVNQAEAQVQLIGEKLARAAVAAPFDGIVVSGDLHQLLGTPVELGKVLFEVAPLDAYRVILKVDERDIGWVREGHSGELVLSGVPGRKLGFSVARVTPVSTAEEGRNFFRVEARMNEASDRLRPGMEGVGKISAGERRYIWIWTHRLVDWMRVAFWTWLP